MTTDEPGNGGTTDPTPTEPTPEETGATATATEPQDRRVLSRRRILVGGASAAAVGGLAVWGGVRLRGAPGEDLVAAAVDALPTPDPDDAAWGDARPALVPLEPQQMVTPHLPDGTLPDLEVRALFDGRDLAIRLEWEDESADEHEGIGTFQDAAAVMLPAVPGGEEPPPIFMGWEGNAVYIAQWRASWQADVDRGYQDVGDLFPNWYSDVHHEHETLVELGLDAETASVFAPGRDVGNPLSQRERPSPVEELTAEGYGTLAHAREQRARGRGVHRDGRWHLVVDVPGGGPAPELGGGATVPVAFAVWHGDARQVGGRKNHSQWIDLTLP